MSDIDKAFGTKGGDGILNTIILMVKKPICEIDKKEEVHTLMKLNITFISRWNMSCIVQKSIKNLRIS